MQVTERVVDVLETIEVEEQHSEALLRIPMCSRERVAESIYEHRAVGEAGERILKARGPYGLPRFVLLVDIRLSADDTGRLALCILDDFTACQHPAVFAALELDPVPLLDDGHLACDACVDDRAQAGEILRMDPAQPALEVVLDLIRVVPQHLFPSI